MVLLVVVFVVLVGVILVGVVPAVVAFEPLRGRRGGDDGGGRDRHQGFRRLQLVRPRRPSIVEGGVIALLDGTFVGGGAAPARGRGRGRALLTFFLSLIIRH